jgi:hypothetical protein
MSTSHRRPGLLERWGVRRSKRAMLIPAPRRVGVELVDARTQLRHRISHEAMLNGRNGVYRALCGAWVLAASFTARGRGQCRWCRS